MTPAELHERAVAALVRVWGVSDAEAREAIDRCIRREERVGVMVAHGQVWAA